MNRWAKTDPTAAATWLGNLSEGPSRDAAVGAFTNRITPSDPQAAVQWAATISDETLRENQTESAVRAWLKVDPSNARVWIGNSGLPDQIKTRLLPPQG